MNAQPVQTKWKQGCGLIALAIALTLQSCSSANKVVTECVQLQEAIKTNQASFSNGTINKASETATAQDEKAFADALAAVELNDSKLKEKRDRLVDFSREAHTLSLQAATVMTEDGYLSDNASAQYQTISTQRITVNNQLFAEQSGLQIHCSLQ